MRRIVAGALVAMASLVPVAGRPPERKSDEAVARQLMQMERDWSAAFLKHDTATVERILADDYVGTDGRGVLTDKAAELREVAAPAPGAPPAWVVLDEQVGDMKVRVYGDAAVVTGVVTERVRFEGDESTVRYRRTTVYVKRAGRWQCVSFHGSRILEPSS